MRALSARLKMIGRGAEHDLLQCVEKVLLTDLVLVAPGRQQRRFVDQVLQVSPGEPRRRGGQLP